jgi:hypothetical protein
MPPTPKRGWIWFFVALVVLTVTAIVVQIWYNAGQQLTPDKLALAEARWQEHRPRDYDMEYSTKRNDNAEESFQVEVRGGKAVSVVMNGNQPLEPRQLRYHTMEALFGYIEDFLKKDTEPGSPRTFATASFDAEDGHLLRYVRSVTYVASALTRRERQEIRVQRFERIAGKQ